MRHFAVVAVLAAVASVTGCMGPNPAPTYDADANRSLKFPGVLSEVGAQAKIRLPGQDVVMLVWRTPIGFGGTDLCCHHCGHELVYKAKEQTIECPRGIVYKLDGTYMSGKIRDGEKIQPLRAYLVEIDGDRLKISG